jgi:hypothetical protein
MMHGTINIRWPIFSAESDFIRSQYKGLVSVAVELKYEMKTTASFQTRKLVRRITKVHFDLTLQFCQSVKNIPA